MESIKIQATQPIDEPFRPEDYVGASEKTLSQLHRVKLEVIAELVGVEGPYERFEVRGDIIRAILEARGEEN